MANRVQAGIHRANGRAAATAHFLLCCFAALLFSVLPACANIGRIQDENSRLRRENHELKAQVARQQERIGRLQGQIAALEKKIETPSPALPDVQRSDLTVVSAIELGKYSGAYDSDGDGSLDEARVYLHTLDQHGRFVPAVGRAVMQVVAIRASGPVELGKQVFEPKAFTDAYVSGLAGTHFTLEAKLPTPPPAEADDLTIKVTFTDAATGASFSKQMVQKLRSASNERE